VATLLERLGKAFWGSDRVALCDPSSPAMQIMVRCAKCGELIRTRIDKATDLEAEYENGNGNGNGHYEEGEEPRPSGYSLHKELVGAKCQRLIRLTMRLDSHRMVISRTIEGGEFADVIDCE